LVAGAAQADPASNAGFVPCASGVLASMAPCSAAPGTTLKVKVTNPNRIYTALVFSIAGANLNGRTAPTAHSPLAGKGSRMYSTTLPAALCSPPNGGHLIYDVYLAGALGIWLDKLGEIDVICPK
jgi:hypothetical protein